MATITLGGGPNPPVMLDPAQVITEVHWPPRNIVVTLSASLTVGFGPYEFDGGGPPFTEVFTLEYAPSVQLDVDATPILSAFLGGDSGWAVIAADEIEATGFPNFEEHALGYWQWNWGGGFGKRHPRHEWQNGTAISGPHVTAPEGAGSFSRGLDPVVKLIGQRINPGAPFPVPSGGSSFPGKWGEPEHTAGPTAVDTEIGEEEFPLGGVSLTWRGRSYQAAASIVVDGPGPTSSGTIYVLFQRVPPTP
jgi:hypothetical protein